MVRSLLIAVALVVAGCAGNLEKSVARHDANALALENAGKRDAALREREKAERERDALKWRQPEYRDYVPRLTAF